MFTIKHPSRTLAGALAAVSAVAALTSGIAGAAPVTANRVPMGASTASGQAMPVGDLPSWHQVFTDDFATDVAVGKFPAAVKDKWGAYPSPWKDSTKHGVYSPSDVVSVGKGMLTKYIHSTGSVHKIAALLPDVPGPTRGQLY